MTDIILARHGETAWNAERIFRGRVDVGLDQTGVKEAELLAEHLKHCPVTTVYSSPLKRAFATADAIVRHHATEVKISPQLIDMDFGCWQGKSLKEVERSNSALYDKWLNSPEAVTIPGGEGLQDIATRATELVRSVAAQGRGTAVMVSHRVVIKVLICALLDMDLSRFWSIRVDTASISTFRYSEEAFVLTGHNDTSFLKGLKRSPLGDF